MDDQLKTTADIETWVHEYADALFDWAFYKTSRREVAEDLVQDTFIAALQHGDQFRGDSSPKSWLMKILNNKIIDYYRKTASQATVLSSGTGDKAFDATELFFDENGNWISKTIVSWKDDAHLLDDEEFNRILAGCLENLPENWRQAVTFKYLFEKPAPEICQELNLSMSNYWQVIHRAKLLLKKCLDVRYFKQL